MAHGPAFIHCTRQRAYHSVFTWGSKHRYQTSTSGGARAYCPSTSTPDYWAGQADKAVPYLARFLPIAKRAAVLPALPRTRSRYVNGQCPCAVYRAFRWRTAHGHPAPLLSLSALPAAWTGNGLDDPPGKFAPESERVKGLNKAAGPVARSAFEGSAAAIDLVERAAHSPPAADRTDGILPSGVRPLQPNKECLALMCLAEALLRVPDAKTAVR